MLAHIAALKILKTKVNLLTTEGKLMQLYIENHFSIHVINT